jgi:hypothetical protein
MQNLTYRIDASGTLLVGGDSASTSAKHALLLLIALLNQNDKVKLTADPDSTVKNIAYDSSSDVLSWEESGSGQTYSLGSAAELQGLFSTSYAEAFKPNIEVLEALADVKTALEGAVGDAVTSVNGHTDTTVGDSVTNINAHTDEAIGTIEVPESTGGGCKPDVFGRAAQASSIAGAVFSCFNLLNNSSKGPHQGSEKTL